MVESVFKINRNYSSEFCLLSKVGPETAFSWWASPLSISRIVDTSSCAPCLASCGINCAFRDLDVAMHHARLSATEFYRGKDLLEAKQNVVWTTMLRIREQGCRHRYTIGTDFSIRDLERLRIPFAPHLHCVSFSKLTNR